MLEQHNLLRVFLAFYVWYQIKSHANETDLLTPCRRHAKIEVHHTFNLFLVNNFKAFPFLVFCSLQKKTYAKNAVLS